ncbi:response regulator transcription factor [Paenibacillus antibioticophila]|uniref:response regulator transcription factor n=1 Tax=Paenibacillus antibioticophila TaxID=1274374 RepID=UPI0005CAA598|nr:helix-turn-helix domain-containing protein [Paenibacillus antibioticophila]
MMNVLLVDDEPWVIEGLRTMVNWMDHGFQVCGEASNGPDAFRMIQELGPELVLTDINMPVINGLELIEQSNRVMARPPKFIILSGYDNFNYALTAMHQRVAEYLLKPIDEEEIEAVLVRLRRRIMEELETEQSQSRMHFLLVNNLVNRLLQGEDSAQLMHQTAHTLLLPEDALLRCILIEASGDTSDLRRQARKYFAETPERIFEDSAGRIGVILPDDKFPYCRVQELAAGLYNELKNESNGPVTVTVSNALQGIGSVRELYMQVLEVNKCKRCQERDGVHNYRDLRQHGNTGNHAREKFKQLLELVTAGQTDEIHSAVEDALASMTEGLPDLRHAMAHVADLELNLCRRIGEMNGEPDAFMKKVQDEYGNIGSFKTYSSLRKYVLELCLEAARVLAGLEEKNEHNTIFHVIQYVDREYRGRLQLQDLAKMFHMNSTYLGQLFKKETGKPFNDYLNEKRIEEAKRLLKRTQMKISEIALQVGYPNTDYFISKFKCKTGMLPSVYKQESKRPAY